MPRGFDSQISSSSPDTISTSYVAPQNIKTGFPGRRFRKQSMSVTSASPTRVLGLSPEELPGTQVKSCHLEAPLPAQNLQEVQLNFSKLQKVEESMGRLTALKLRLIHNRVKSRQTLRIARQQQDERLAELRYAEEMKAAALIAMKSKRKRRSQKPIVLSDREHQLLLAMSHEMVQYSMCREVQTNKSLGELNRPLIGAETEDRPKERTLVGSSTDLHSPTHNTRPISDDSDGELFSRSRGLRNTLSNHETLPLNESYINHKQTPMQSFYSKKLHCIRRDIDRN